MTKLSVIIPFRCEHQSTHYLINRLEDLLTSLPTTLPIEFMVIDSGSAPIYQQECQSLCQQHQISYLYHDSLGQPFSIGACRDFGVRHANGKAVSFLDVDLRVAPDFWQRLLVLMEAWGISKYKKSFLAIPCLYLTQEGTIEFLEVDNDIKFTDFYLRYLQGDKVAIENLALCSSVMVVDRVHYLSVGGHDLAFRGHGYEDFELYHRLLCEENIIPKTKDYYLDQKTWNTFTYKGFRSHLAMIGRPAMMMNLFVVHLWHPRPKTASFYAQKSITHNRTIYVDKFKQFVETQFHPEPLSQTDKNVLFFGKQHTNASSCLKDVFPFLGNVVYVSEYHFVNQAGDLLVEDFTHLLTHHHIDKIIFPNPYGNPARLAIYQWCKQNDFPFYCYERGALPDSWFFDPHGFNADSISYSPTIWDKPLSDEQQQTVANYLHDCLFGSNFLEKQSDRIGGEALLHKLQIGAKKVLFVPLQRPSDTVIKYLAGNIQTYANFLQVIDEIAQNLMSKGWVVLCKKHPLETESPNLQYAKYVPEDTHFMDLLEMADRVALINSGVGIYSLMLKKPTYIFGEAFYAHEGLNKTVEAMDFTDQANINTLTKDIIAGHVVDVEKMHRFIHYLVEEFYSFGTAKTITRTEKDNSLRTITTGIDFYQLRLDGNLVFNYEKVPRPALSLSAPLFERYGLDIHLAHKKTEPTATAIPSNTGATKTANKTATFIINHLKNEKRRSSVQAKLAKFKRDPYNFFNDSKNPVIRMGRVFFEDEKIQ